MQRIFFEILREATALIHYMETVDLEIDGENSFGTIKKRESVTTLSRFRQLHKKSFHEQLATAMDKTLLCFEDNQILLEPQPGFLS